MSEKKTKIDQLLQRIDELLTVLNMISRDLAETAKALKGMTNTSAASVAPVAVVEEKKKALEDVKQLFPESLEEMLTFEEVKDFIVIKPRQFLGSENFAKIAAIVRDAGGEYVSAGRESHFRIPREVG
jgi:predicted AAA+ superfamily ATPase